ncbi:MAG: hypothetical protein Q7V57_18760 [Actinomycetota bacterium]|nr:hypothetical protein [Actinomycetota bacterium]
MVAQIVDAGGVDQAVAECAADALFSTMSDADLQLINSGKEPSAEGKTAFTNAVLDCMSGGTEPMTTEPVTTDAPTTVAATTGELSQWADSGEATTQYGENAWSADQAAGAPNVTECGDNSSAWAPLTTNEVAVLTVTYAKAVVPSEVTVVQSYHPGTITMVEVIDADGNATTIYTGLAAEAATCPLSQVFAITDVTTAVQQVRITIDETALNLGWTEVDAVELVGTTD